MTKFPKSTFFFLLSPHSLIMNPSINLKSHVLDAKRLESLMLRDKPVVPPDSVIRTFSHLKGDKVDLILTQDNEGLAQGSFILRRGEWAKFFLDTWFDPLYRSYNFQKAEGHALVCHPSPPHQTSIPLSLLALTTLPPTGTHRPMASHHPHQTRPRPPTPHQLLRRRHRLPRRQRSNAQRRRIRRPSHRLRARFSPLLRKRIRYVLPAVEGVAK